VVKWWYYDEVGEVVKVLDVVRLPTIEVAEVVTYIESLQLGSMLLIQVSAESAAGWNQGKDVTE